jgi:L-threonylcarbamoyladenylate synthase
MPTPVLAIDPAHPDPAAIRRAADVIRAGGLVAFPTETVYGLGANALDAKAVGRIFAAKGRPAHNPLIVHVADEDQARRVADGWPEAAEKLADAFWPGPLTLVLPRSVAVSERVTAGGVTVAVRCPVHPVARSLILAAGVPIAAPSANHSGELSPTRAEHVTVEGVDLILDGGPCSGGIESTVVDVTRPTVRLLRPGPITVARLEAVVGRMEIAPRAGTGPLPSPGMLARHYAPRTRLELAETEDEADTLARVYETAGLRVARWKPTGSPEEVAARLYADLHALDAAGYDRIVAARRPRRPRSQGKAWRRTVC